MSFVRSGPRMLIVEVNDEDHFRSFIKNHFVQMELSNTVKTFEDIISAMNHHQTLIYIAGNARENIQHFLIDKCIVINDSAQSFLMHVINFHAGGNVKFVRKSPRIIIMKVIGDIEKTIKDISEDFKASIEPTKTVITDHSEGTVILFTKGNLNKRLEFAELYSKSVYTTEHFSETINSLDHHALKYINRSTASKDWYNLIINIKDRFEEYKAHYDRLIYVFDCLGVGMVLKEGWSEDTGKLFSAQGGYKVILYTYMEPLEIKKIVYALEYMENGEHIADFELYYKKKRIGRDEIKVKNINAPEKLSNYFRQELYKSLELDDIEYLRSLEDYIFASR